MGTAITYRQKLWASNFPGFATQRSGYEDPIFLRKKELNELVKVTQLAHLL